MDQGDIVTTIVPTEEHEGDLKILGKLAQLGLRILRQPEPSGVEGSFTCPLL